MKKIIGGVVKFAGSIIIIAIGNAIGDEIKARKQSEREIEDAAVEFAYEWVRNQTYKEITERATGATEALHIDRQEIAEKYLKEINRYWTKISRDFPLEVPDELTDRMRAKLGTKVIQGLRKGQV